MTSSSKYTLLIKLLSFLKVPLLYSASPKITKLDEKNAEVFLPFKRKNKNHVGSMYFGALAMGAELSIAITAIKEIRESGEKIQFIFKDFQAQFLQRVQGDAYFVCKDPAAVKSLIDKAQKSKERLEQSFEGFAYVDSQTREPVLTYSLCLSVKKKS